MERMDGKRGGTEKTKGKGEEKSHQGSNKFMLSVCMTFVDSN